MPKPQEVIHYIVTPGGQIIVLFSIDMGNTIITR